MSELKFKDTSQLARAILRENTTEAKELNDYVEYRRLVFPVMVGRHYSGSNSIQSI